MFTLRVYKPVWMIKERYFGLRWASNVRFMIGYQSEQGFVPRIADNQAAEAAPINEPLDASEPHNQVPGKDPVDEWQAIKKWNVNDEPG